MLIKRRLSVVLALLALFGLSALVAVWFVAQERLLYYSDIRFYHQLALQSWQQLQAGLEPWLDFLQQRFGQDYNALYTLPLLPGIALGGDSRSVYIALLALCYLAPAALIAGLLGRMLYPSAGSRVFWLSVVLLLGSAALWQPLLRGYPDVGGVLLISLALCLSVRDSALQSWHTVLGLAVLSGLTILFRRHFGYAVVALYAALGIKQGLLLWRQRADWSNFARDWLQFGLRLALALTGAVLLMMALAPEFTWRALTVDYGELYRSFQQTPSQAARFLLQGFGLVLPGLAVLGGLLAWRRGRLRGEHALLLVLLAGFWIIAFVFWVRQPGHHYRIHWLPLLSGLGLAFLVLELHRINRAAALGVLGLVFVVAGYAVIGYNTGLRHFVGEPNRLLWPEPVEAWRHHEKDYGTYLRLAEVLHRESADDERLYVATSSPLIGDDILLAAEELISTQRRLQPLPVAAVDSRDFYPIVALVAADLVLIPQPALLTVPDEQQVLQISVDVFAQNWLFSRDFRRLPEQFRLSDGSVLSIYRRERPTAVPVLISTLDRMRSELEGIQPGMQADWISANWDTVSVQLQADRTVIHLQTEPQLPSSLVYAQPLQQNAVLRGRASHLTCGDAGLQGVLYESSGQHIRTLPPLDLHLDTMFELAIPVAQRVYLALHLTSVQTACSAQLTALRIEQ